MSVTKVKKNIKKIYKRRRAALYALALDYAARAIKFFRSVQPQRPNSKGLFWHNRTGQASARMFTGAEIADNWVSWFMSHGVQYGVYLELANDRRDEALNPIISEFTFFYLKDVRTIFSDN